jgi:hypothetical protein
MQLVGYKNVPEHRLYSFLKQEYRSHNLEPVSIGTLGDSTLIVGAEAAGFCISESGPHFRSLTTGAAAE